MTALLVALVEIIAEILCKFFDAPGLVIFNFIKQLV